MNKCKFYFVFKGSAQAIKILRKKTAPARAVFFSIHRLLEEIPFLQTLNFHKKAITPFFITLL